MGDVINIRPDISDAFKEEEYDIVHVSVTVSKELRHNKEVVDSAEYNIAERLGRYMLDNNYILFHNAPAKEKNCFDLVGCVKVHQVKDEPKTRS